MGPQIIKYEKLYPIGPQEMENPTETLKDIKNKKLNRILSMQPILARGVLDGFIEFVKDSEPPQLIWKRDILEGLGIDHLSGILTFIENRLELQQRTY